MLTKEEFKNFYDNIISLDEAINKMLDFGFNLDSEIIKKLMNINSTQVKNLENLMEDEYETIAWFIWENDCGKNNFEIIDNKIEYHLKNSDDLYNYLANVQKRDNK